VEHCGLEAEAVVQDGAIEVLELLKVEHQDFRELLLLTVVATLVLWALLAP
jgi:hypothetical protein